MQTERVHSLILGAGPSGLAAGYMLAKAGVKPVVLEKDKVPGGLMRSIKHGDFIMDRPKRTLQPHYQGGRIVERYPLPRLSGLSASRRDCLQEAYQTDRN